LIAWVGAALAMRFALPRHSGEEMRVIGELLVTVGAAWFVGTRAARANGGTAYVTPLAVAALLYGVVVAHLVLALRPGGAWSLPWLWRLVLPITATVATAMAVWRRGEREAALMTRAIVGGGLAGLGALGLLYCVYFYVFVVCWRNVVVHLIVVGAMLAFSGYVAGTWSVRTLSLRVAWLPGTLTTVLILTAWFALLAPYHGLPKTAENMLILCPVGTLGHGAVRVWQAAVLALASCGSWVRVYLDIRRRRRCTIGK